MPVRAMNGERNAMPKSPEDKADPSTVPNSADQHGSDDVEIDATGRNARSAERNVDVVHQPGSERDVPVTPELRDVGLQVRPVKILRDRNAEEASGADRDVRVRRKVRVDFHAVGEEPQRKNGAVCEGDIGDVEMVGVRGHKI